MLTTSITLDRLLMASFLAALAIAVAFGPELRRLVTRLRSRRAGDVAPQDLGIEPQQF